MSTDVIPAKTYPGQDKDNKIATVWNILVTNDKMPDDLAYTIVKTIFDKKADLVAVHQEADKHRLQVSGQGRIRRSRGIPARSNTSPTTA